jgi:hypothetical protein
VIANTDAQALAQCAASEAKLVQLGPNLTGGLGAGADAQVGKTIDVDFCCFVYKKKKQQLIVYRQRIDNREFGRGDGRHSTIRYESSVSDGWHGRRYWHWRNAGHCARMSSCRHCHCWCRNITFCFRRYFVVVVVVVVVGCCYALNM